MTQKSVVFIFALCALCTLSGPFHGSAEPIPLHGEGNPDKPANPMDKGISIVSFFRLFKNHPSTHLPQFCEYSLHNSKGKGKCIISKPRQEVECSVSYDARRYNNTSCHQFTGKKIKIEYTTDPKGEPVFELGKTERVVGVIRLKAMEVEPFDSAFEAPLVYNPHESRNHLLAGKYFNGYEVIGDTPDKGHW